MTYDHKIEVFESLFPSEVKSAFEYWQKNVDNRTIQKLIVSEYEKYGRNMFCIIVHHAICS
jgi:hypothetical protein